MRKLLLVMLLLLFCGFAVGQDATKGELFAGYSFAHFDCHGCNDANVPAGFDVDGTYYLFKNLGLTGDFDYHHKSLSLQDGSGYVSAFSFHTGPRFKVRIGKLEPFAHALFGITDIGFSNNAKFLNSTGSCFSLKLGGGVDVAAFKHVALRLGEFNYYRTDYSITSPVNLNGQGSQNNYTFSAGIVLR